MNNPIEPSKFRHHTPKKAVLTKAERDKVHEVACALVLSPNGTFNDNTLLMDKNGTVRTEQVRTGHPPNTKIRYGWTYFAGRIDENSFFKSEAAKGKTPAIQPLSDTELLKEFCTQSPHDTTRTWQQKGRFMRAVLKQGISARKLDRERPLLIEEAEARRLLEKIPGRPMPVPDWMNEEPVEAIYCGPPLDETPSTRVNGVRISYPPAPRQLGYHEKLRLIASGEPQMLTGGEFLRFLLINRDVLHISLRPAEKDIKREFETLIGRAPNYLSSDVFHNSTIPSTLHPILCAMVKTADGGEKTAAFWGKSEFSSDEAKGLIVDWNANVAEAVRRIAHARKIPEAYTAARHTR